MSQESQGACRIKGAYDIAYGIGARVLSKSHMGRAGYEEEVRNDQKDFETDPKSTNGSQMKL